MGSSAAEILRQQLREKFPQAHGVRVEPVPFVESGKPFNREAFPAGGLSEVVCSSSASGVQLLMAALLGETEKIVSSIGSFALYGFPESHAISFALIAYASCWLKVHHPAEFYAGLLNNQPMSFYSVNTLIQDAKRHGMRILPVSCLWGGEQTEEVDDNTLRLGLLRLKGLTRDTAARLMRERDRKPFSSLGDFLGRVRPSAKEKRLLAHAGALNELPEVEHRREALWQVELPLFDDLLKSSEPANQGIMPPMEMVERLTADFSTQGASVGPHPMRLWRERSGSRKIQRARDLQILPHGCPVTVAGMAICRQFEPLSDIDREHAARSHDFH